MNNVVKKIIKTYNIYNLNYNNCNYKYYMFFICARVK